MYMKFDELIILLPCHTLDDFAVYRQGSEADGLLAAWTALWHPALLASAGSMPAWYPAEDPPASLPGRLVVIPWASRRKLPVDWAQRISGEGSLVLENVSSRDELLAAALAQLEEGETAVDEDLAGDFLALGYCYLQIELLSRKMHYDSHVDLDPFQTEVLAAARATVRGELEVAREGLVRSFDVLAQARDHFYPVDAYLIDLTLLAPSTLGQALREELAEGRPTNLVVSGEVVDQMARLEPDSLVAVREALKRGTVSIVGGEYTEGALPLAPIEMILDELRRGEAVYREHLGVAPEVYGRRGLGLSPVLPQILHKHGFIGALHVALDGGQIPRANQCKARWEGVDGAAIDALGATPHDASCPECFLQFARHLGDSIEKDHVATLILAHWPGKTSCWYHDLRRIEAYGGVLGKFVTLDDYFNKTDVPDRLARFSADQYHWPYLRRAVDQGEKDPISRHVRAHRAHAEASARKAVATLSTLVQGNVPAVGDRGLAEGVKELAEGLAGDAVDSLRGRLVINPLSHSRHVAVDPHADSNGPQGGDGGGSKVIVEVPAMGFAWVSPRETEQGDTATSVLLAEENVLRNEYFEVTVNPTTGGIQAMRGYGYRGNQFSQQIAFRHPSARAQPGETWRDPGASAIYSVMAADSVAVTHACAAVGEVTSRGHLVNHHGERLAGFVQTMRVLRGSRVLELEIELDVDEPPGADPWDSYYAVRLAWSDPDAELWRDVGMARAATHRERLEAVHFVEIQSGESRLAILPAGLAFHRRSGERMLDTLLVVRGETARKFRLGIGLDISYPLSSGLNMLMPDDRLTVAAAAPVSGRKGWFFHVGAKNITATHWEPLIEGDRTTGLRVRLLESEGRGGRVPFGTFREVGSARQTDFQSRPLADLPIEAGEIMIDIAGYEWVQVEMLWK